MPEASIGMWAYPAVFLALVAAGLGFPIPEEIPVVTGGALCAHAASHDPTPPPEWAAALAVPGAAGDPILSAAIAADWAAREAIPHKPKHPIWYLMLPVCILGVVTCDAFLYTIGRWGGPPATRTSTCGTAIRVSGTSGRSSVRVSPTVR